MCKFFMRKSAGRLVRRKTCGSGYVKLQNPDIQLHSSLAAYAQITGTCENWLPLLKPR